MAAKKGSILEEEEPCCELVSMLTLTRSGLLRVGPAPSRRLGIRLRRSAPAAPCLRVARPPALHRGRRASRSAAAGGRRTWPARTILSRTEVGTRPRLGADLEDEREADEDAAAPPARLREQVARLAGAEQRVARRRAPPNARGHAAALPALQQNGGDEDERVDDEQDRAGTCRTYGAGRWAREKR